MTRGQDGRYPLGGTVMRAVALGMADGQIEQADRWLLVAAGLEKGPRGWHGGYNPVDPLVRALEHMRSACKWMEATA